MSRRNSIPILYTRGTYYQVGYNVGRTFRSLIEDFLSSIKAQHQSLIKHFITGQGRESYNETMKTLEENFPQYLREIRGTADGAKVPFEQLMVLHLIQRDQHEQDLADGDPTAGEVNFGCTGISLNLENEVLLGHTEDSQSEMLNNLYIVDAHISEEEPQGKWRVRNEKFTALCYAGYLPGLCMGYNHHGLVYTGNVITPLKTNSGKTPRYFLYRAILAAGDMPSLHRILRDEGVGAGDGLTINAFFVNEDGTHQVSNIEVGPDTSGGKESKVSSLVLETGEYLLHTNKYLRLQVPERKTLLWESSEARHARASKLPPPVSRQALLNLLSDEGHPQHPFFRSNDRQVVTASLALFDIRRKTLTMWMKNPKTSDPICVLPISFKWDQKLKNRY